jgi:hypothetical protein
VDELHASSSMVATAFVLACDAPPFSPHRGGSVGRADFAALAALWRIAVSLARWMPELQGEVMQHKARVCPSWPACHTSLQCGSPGMRRSGGFAGMGDTPVAEAVA